MILDSVVKDVKSTVHQIVFVLSRRLTVDDNLQATRTQVTASDSADTEFEVSHTLGRIPVGYIVNTDRAAIVYDSRRTEWTSSSLYLKCTVPSTVLNIIIW